MDDRDEEGWTALLAACSNGDEEICKILLEAGADINCRDNYGQTPLSETVNTRIYELLLEMGAERG